jgi:phospho-N-acetylmuramoyl-pentapeptide-transferase
VLYLLLVPLKKYSIIFNPLGYITVRTALAGITALLITLFLGPWIIKLLKKYQIGEEIRAEGPKSHIEKKGTPSMGGILIISATLIPTLLWGNLNNTYVWLAMLTMFSFGVLGFWDDFMKIKLKKSSGLIIRHKFIFQILLSTAIGLVLIYLGSQGKFDLHLSLPFIKKWAPYLGWFYLPDLLSV